MTEYIQAMGYRVLLVAVRHVVAHADGNLLDHQIPMGEVGEHVGLDIVAL